MRRGSRSLVPLLFLGLALLATGCVRYVPVTLAAAPPGEEVRVHLTDDAAVRMMPHFGLIETDLFGAVAPVGADSMSVNVWIGKDYQGTPFENVHEKVVLGRDEVVGIGRREISVSRSAVVVAGVVAGFAALVYGLKQVGNPNADNQTPPPQPPPSGNVGTLLHILTQVLR